MLSLGSIKNQDHRAQTHKTDSTVSVSQARSIPAVWTSEGEGKRAQSPIPPAVSHCSDTRTPA